MSHSKISTLGCNEANEMPENWKWNLGNLTNITRVNKVYNNYVNLNKETSTQKPNDN
jgi:hypothetical protein